MYINGIQLFQFTLSDQSFKPLDKTEWWSGYSLEFAYKDEGEDENFKFLILYVDPASVE